MKGLNIRPDTRNLKEEKLGTSFEFSGKEKDVLGGRGHEDKGDEPPDLSMKDRFAVKVQIGGTQGGAAEGKAVEQVDDDISNDDVSHQAGDAQAGMF